MIPITLATRTPCNGITDWQPHHTVLPGTVERHAAAPRQIRAIERLQIVRIESKRPNGWEH